MDDLHELDRFVDAQTNVYAEVLQELAMGRKRTHWMWFIFPQLDGLGSSAMARRFAIKTLAEARAYVHHTLLGNRLRECTNLVLQLDHRPIGDIFGFPDDRKFHSSMTLFCRTGPSQPFAAALDKYFGSEMDPRTLQLLDALTA